MKNMHNECEGCDEELCQDCCQHDDLDHNICIQCEKDFSGEL
jgi:hypothetical protein